MLRLFFPLENNSATIGRNILLESMSAIIVAKTISTVFFFVEL